MRDRRVRCTSTSSSRWSRCARPSQLAGARCGRVCRRRSAAASTISFGVRERAQRCTNAGSIVPVAAAADRAPLALAVLANEEVPPPTHTDCWELRLAGQAALKLRGQRLCCVRRRVLPRPARGAHAAGSNACPACAGRRLAARCSSSRPGAGAVSSSPPRSPAPLPTTTPRRCHRCERLHA